MLVWDEILKLFITSFESYVLLILTAVTCALIGAFLVLRKLSMIADAISHSVLLGIVLGFFLAGNLDSPLLIIGAATFGILTVWATEGLTQTGLVENDDAVGIVYPFFFALAVILITRFASNVHLDMDVVLTGEVLFAPFARIELFGWDLPRAVVEMVVLFGVNLLFMTLCFKELKVTTFDRDFGYMAGYNMTVLFYLLMTLVSITTVVSFDAVGAILVVAFLVGPGATAYLTSKTLSGMLTLSACYAFWNATLGYIIGIVLNVSIGGMASVITGLTFILVFLFHRQGLITSLIIQRRRKHQLKQDLILLHIQSHTQQNQEQEELAVDTLSEHFKWGQNIINTTLKELFKADLIYVDADRKIYQLTSLGQARLDYIREYYEI